MTRSAWYQLGVTSRAPLRVPPRWQILQPLAAAAPDAIALRLASGPGFGDGSHPTTQLCLQAVSAFARRDRPWRMLDFGSGSGVLSIAGALLGASVEAVEIDPAAIEHARANLAANGVEDRVRQHRTMEDVTGAFDLVVGNILRSVLLHFADDLAARRASGGALVLSGLVSTDVPEVIAAYAPRLGGARPEVYSQDEWRALAWRHRA